jgi:hypothetical protein
MAASHYREWLGPDPDSKWCREVNALGVPVQSWPKKVFNKLSGPLVADSGNSDLNCPGLLEEKDDSSILVEIKSRPSTCRDSVPAAT